MSANSPKTTGWQVANRDFMPDLPCAGSLVPETRPVGMRKAWSLPLGSSLLVADAQVWNFKLPGFAEG